MESVLGKSVIDCSFFGKSVLDISLFNCVGFLKCKMYPIKWTRGIKKDLGSGHEKGGDVPQKWTEIRIAKPRDGQLWYTGKRGRDIDGAQTQAQQLWPI